MKKVLIRYRSVCVIAGSLVFNLVSSLLVYKPEGVVINKTPLTITEWICDILSMTLFFVGMLMLLYDSNKDGKESVVLSGEE